MRNNYCQYLTLLLPLLLWGQLQAQTIGIGTDFPTATLDIVTTTDMPGVRLTRSLTPATASAAAMVINDDSDMGALRINYTNTVEAGTVQYISNAGIGNAFILDMLNNGGVAFAQLINNTSDAAGGILIDNTSTSAIGIQILLDDGSGVRNLHSDPAPDPYGSFYTDLSQFPNLASSISNIGYIANLDGSDGRGFYFYNNDNFGGGDGFGFMGFTETLTASVGNVTFGSLFAGEQNGLGHGILINHDGSGGRNAEFNIEGRNNTDPAIFSVHEGEGGAMVIQNQKSSLSSQIIVADIAYTGLDANFEHIAVYGTSLPSGSRGDGVVGEGNRYGLRSEGDALVNGDAHVNGVLTATSKLFLIDHPLDPQNKILRHYSIESDQVLNVYQGTTRIGRRGEVTVEFPDYVQAININFTYQLTSIGTPVQPYVKRKVQDGAFVIAGKPGAEVSWLVIANRNDAYVQTHPDFTNPEVKKSEEEQGKYLDPFSHGQPETMGIFYFYKELKIAAPTSLPDEEISTAASKYDLIEQYTIKEKIERLRAEGKVERLSITPMQIDQQVRTWDEIK